MGEFQVTIVPSNSDVSPRSEGWTRERATLTEAVKRIPELEKVERIEHQLEGTRGGMGELVATLANAGAFSALVLVVRAWLAKDKARDVTFTAKKDGQEVTFSVAAMDDTKVQELLAPFLNRR